MNIALHFARVQRRVSDAPDELDDGEDLLVEQLALDTSGLPDLTENPGPVQARAFVDAFLERTRVQTVEAGGEIEPVVAE
jgi:hypothetical protein